jgi:hypothetical protein
MASRKEIKRLKESKGFLQKINSKLQLRSEVCLENFSIKFYERIWEEGVEIKSEDVIAFFDIFEGKIEVSNTYIQRDFMQIFDTFNFNKIY